ncbi:DUF2140 domain-containing protein [Kurthia sibirica]|uniref:DUF2140 domain-containing protein n=2 Tax=Kurthia sibirica TaxID=202750 RepID=A0A2U3APK3_9BACL|nr:DUF2140 domain-containing protein [Kurthia sibirica]
MLIKMKNKWKVAFISLATAVLVILILVTTLLFSGGKNMAKPEPKVHNGSVVTITTKPIDFEKMANKMIGNATNGSALQAYIKVDDDVKIKSNVEALGVNVPITLDFEPEVDDQGNIILHQTNVTVGLLDLPAQAALKLLRDSNKLPDWITVQPSDKTAYMDLSAVELPIGSENAHLQAKEFDLTNNKIVLDIIVP